MNTPVVSDDALKFMESNTIDFIQTKRLIESTNLREFYKFGMSYETLERDFLIPPGNRTDSVTGKLITVENNARYFRFPAKMKLYDANESYGKVEPKVQSLVERGKAKRRSLVVFVNGSKVPDADVYVYASPAGTDIFIPITYFSQFGLNDVVCVLKNYSDGYYNNYYNANQHGDKVFNIPTNIGNLTHEMVNVWVNGKYVAKDDYTISPSASRFNIVFKPGYMITDLFSIEVLLDKHQIAKHSENFVGSDKKVTVYVPKDASVLTETSIFVNMCDIYINGDRISPSKLTQKTHRHIRYEKTLQDNELESLVTEIVLSDNNVEAKAFADYVNDFMEYEKWAKDEITQKVMDNNAPEGVFIKPDFVSLDKLSFPAENKYKFDDSKTFELSNEQRAIMMIRENRHYIKNILKWWAVEEETYNVKRNGIVKPGEKVTINLDMDSSDAKNVDTRNIELFVNDKKVPDNDLLYINQWGTDNIQIPISKFSTGSGKTDKVRLYKYDSENTMIPFYKFSTGSEIKGHGEFRIESIDGVDGSLGEFKLDELRVFRQIQDVESDKEHLFVQISGGSVYYDILPKTEYSLRLIHNPETNKDDLYISIPESSSIGNNEILMIVNPKFHTQLKFRLQDTGDYNSQFRVILNPVESGEIIPVILNDYLVKVFVNGTLLVPELDYILMTPEKYDRLTSSQILFRRVITMDDVIEVEISGIKNKQYAGYREIPAKNKYGFIFFDKLNIPFSLDYMDLYINDKKLCEDDVVVYTDRLIRVKENVLLPMKNIVLYTRLDRDLEDFKPYIDAYNEDECSFDNYIRQFCGNEIFDDTKFESIKDINEIYEDEFDSSDKVLVNVDPDYKSQSRFDTFMDRLARDFNRDVNLVSKIFDANKLKDFTPVEYAILIPEEIRKSRVVQLDANGSDDVSEDFILDANKYYRTDPQIAKLIVDIFHTSETLNELDANVDMSSYRNPLTKNFIYPEDICEFDANVEFSDSEVTEDIIIDANEGN